MKKIVLLFVTLVLFASSMATNLFWIGNSGNWSDATHWSATSGGVSCNCIPTQNDAVFFNANSFTNGGQLVTIDISASCNSMNWTGVTNSPTLAGTLALNIYGSFILNSSMFITFSGNLNFRSTNLLNNIQTFGKSLLSPVLFDGAGGGWILQDNLTTSSSIDLTTGSLNTNGVTVNAFYFTSSGSGVRTLTLGASTLNLSYSGTWAWNVSGTNLSLVAGTSTINLTGSSNYFVTDNRTYYDLNFAGSSTLTMT